MSYVVGEAPVDEAIGGHFAIQRRQQLREVGLGGQMVAAVVEQDHARVGVLFGRLDQLADPLVRRLTVAPALPPAVRDVGERSPRAVSLHLRERRDEALPVGSVPPEGRSELPPCPREPAREDDRVQPAAPQDLRELTDVPERIGNVSGVHRPTELADDRLSDHQVADQRLPADQVLIGQDVPGAGRDAPAADVTAQLVPLLGADRQIVLQDDRLPVQVEDFEVLLRTQGLEQVVDEGNQHVAELLER